MSRLFVLTALLSGCVIIQDDLAQVPIQEDPCAAFSVPGTYRITLPSGRTSVVEIPSGPGPHTGIFMLHGAGGTGKKMKRVAGWEAFAADQNAVIVYPEGLEVPGQGGTWNAGNCCGSAKAVRAADVTFLTELVDEVRERTCVDDVLAAGHSNGGMMVMRAACEGVPFDAAISHAGPLVSGTCPSLKIPVLRTHGTADPVIPWEGGGNNEDVVFPSVEADQAVLSVAAGCDETPGEVKEDGDMLCTYRECEVPMALCAVQDGLHAWPGGDAPRETGPRIEDIGWTWFQQVMETR